MGDLIQQLPEDEIQLAAQDKETFTILFAEEESDVENKKEEEKKQQPAAGLKHELSIFIVYLILFFTAGTPFVDGVLNKFIPLCNRSWIVRVVVKSLIFSLLLWVISNSSYLRV